MNRPAPLALLVLLAACGDDCWSFEYEDGPLEGDHSIALDRTGPGGALLVRAGTRGGVPLPVSSRDERWFSWDLAPGLERAAAVVASIPSESMLLFLDVATGERTLLQHEDGSRVRFSPDGDRLLVVERERLTIRDREGRIVHERPGPVASSQPIWHPDGTAIALVVPTGSEPDVGHDLVLWTPGGTEVVLASERYLEPSPLLFPSGSLLYFLPQAHGAGHRDLSWVHVGGEDRGTLGSPPLFFDWAVSARGDRVAWTQNPEMDDPARWLSPAPMPETDHHLLHTDSLGDRPASRTTFAVPDTTALAFSPDGRLAFRGLRELFVSDPEGKRIVRVAEDLPLGHEIRWIR